MDTDTTGVYFNGDSVLIRMPDGPRWGAKSCAICSVSDKMDVEFEQLHVVALPPYTFSN